MTALDTAVPIVAPRRRSRVWRRLRRDPAALVASAFVVLVIGAALLAPWIAPYDPYSTNLRNMLQPPGSTYLLGTDGQGRDILSRLLYGARLTLAMSLVSITLGGAVGGAMGIFGAYYPRIDGLLGRLTDILLSFPAILFGLTLAAVMGAGAGAVMLALAISTVPDVARIARASAVVVMRQDYMEAGRAVGLSDATLIWRYLTRNCLSSVFVFMTLRFGQIILLGAGLSFLGLGARPPTAELGMMAAQGRDFLFLAPHVSTIPSVAIFAIVLAFNILGDALRDALDPRLGS
jgi:ABC-type dipeptide/oligopeptide/nickel transport system permease subunit